MDAQPILVCDTDQSHAHAVAQRLRVDGYDTTIAQARSQFVWALASHRPAAVVLGDLPDIGETLRLVRDLRDFSGGSIGTDPAVPVVVTSATPAHLCEIRALEAGADAFVDKAAPTALIAARLASVLRRQRLARAPRRLWVGALELDVRAREVRYAGRPIELSRIEFSLLEQLASEPTRVFRRAELLREVWGDVGSSQTRTVDVHASRLRRKLRAAGACDLIVSRRGVGYRLTASEPDPVPA